MKVLFRGTYRQSDGWGRSSQDYLRALQMVPGINLEAKPIVLSQHVDRDQKKWKHVEQNLVGTPDVYIQHCIPNYMEPVPGVRNIGLAHFEVDNIKDTIYYPFLQEMDEVWVSTKKEEVDLVSAGINAFWVPMPIDLDFLDKNTEVFNDENLKDNYVFGFVGSWTERKNLDTLIQAYYLEFSKAEKVKLLLKLSGDQHTNQQNMMEWVSRIQKMMRIHKHTTDYPDIIIILENISDEELVSLQRRFDCFVLSSHGESTCRPLVECVYLGKRAICTAGIGADASYLRNTICLSSPAPCRIIYPPMIDIYTSRENWYDIDINDLRYQMRMEYGAREIKNSEKASENVKKIHSYSAVAKVIGERLAN